jgi:hypothetical protein
MKDQTKCPVRRVRPSRRPMAGRGGTECGFFDREAIVRSLEGPVERLILARGPFRMHGFRRREERVPRCMEPPSHPSSALCTSL